MPTVREYKLVNHYEPPKKMKHTPALPRSSEEISLRENMRAIKVQLKELKATYKNLSEQVRLLTAMRRTGKKPPTLKLYALRLSDNCWYVGMSHNVAKRFNKHSIGKGAKWTQLHRPIEIVEVRETNLRSMEDVASLEDDMTIEYVLKYGSSVVRGGGYCQMKPRWPDVVVQNELLVL